MPDIERIKRLASIISENGGSADSVREYKSGGRIHIKPENRGKFTALKKRTGHSASWFKAHGTPAQKKMAVFALNARKWKHGDGGFLNNYFYDGGPYGVSPLGGDYLSYLQSIPEVYGGTLEPSVATAPLPAKFNGSQRAARNYAEGYLKGAKPTTEAISNAGQKIFDAVDKTAMWIPGPVGMVDWLGHVGDDAINGDWGRVAGHAIAAAAMGGLGYGARKVGESLMNRYSGFRNFAERAGNLLDDLTWNDSRRAEASNLWSRNLDARQRFGIGAEYPEVASGGGPGLMENVGMSVAYKDLNKDTVDNELILTWLEKNNPEVYRGMMDSRRKIWYDVLSDNVAFDDPLSADDVARIGDGTFEWGYNMSSRNWKPSSNGKYTRDQLIRVLQSYASDRPGSPGGKFDLPLSTDITPMTDELDRLVRARDVAHGLLMNAAENGKLSDLTLPIMDSSAPPTINGAFVRTVPRASGSVTYKMGKHNVRKPNIHFRDFGLTGSYSDNAATPSYISIGLRDYFDGTFPRTARDFYDTYGINGLYMDPAWVVAHETGHSHPSFNNSHLLDLGAKEMFLMSDSPTYGNSYLGVKPDLKHALSPKVNMTGLSSMNAFHDSEYAEQISDAVADRTMMSLFGINDGISGIPYTESQARALQAKMGRGSRFQMYHPDIAERTWIYNNGWKYGGKMNRYDGNTEPTQQMDRVPNWKVRGSDYSMWSPSSIQDIINWGATDPKSFFGEEGRDTRESLSRAGLGESVIGGIYDLLPRHQQWLYAHDWAPKEEKERAFEQGIRDYRDTKGVGLTLGALSVPLATMGGVAAAGWAMANPSFAMGVGKFVTPLLGGTATDMAFDRYTPWRSWGHAVGDALGVYDNPLYRYGLGDYGKGFVDAGLEFTNPAFFAPYEQAARGLSRVGVGKGEVPAVSWERRGPGGMNNEEFAEWLATSSDEDIRAFADGVDRETLLPHQKNWRTSALQELDLRRMGILRRRSATPEVAPQPGRRVHLERRYSVNPETGEMMMLTRPEPVASDFVDAGMLEHVPSTRGAAETAQAPVVVPREGSPFAGIREMSDSDLMRLARMVDRGEIGFEGEPISADDFTSIVRSRGNDRLVGRGREQNFSGVGDEELASAISNGADRGAMSMVNYGLGRDNPWYYSASEYEDALRGELRDRILRRANLQYSDFGDVAADLRLANSAGLNLHDRIVEGARPILRDAIVHGRDIPSGIDEYVVSDYVKTLMHDGSIGPENRYFKAAVRKMEDELSTLSIQELAKDYFDFLGYSTLWGGASDYSRGALDGLRSVFPGKSDRQLLQILDDITPQMVQGDAVVPEHLKKAVLEVRKAYSPPTKYPMPVDPLVLARRGAYENIMRKKLSERGVDLKDFSVLLDPFHPDYVEAAAKMREAGVHLLPTDIQAMAMSELVHPKEKLLKGDYDSHVLDMLRSKDRVDEDIEMAFSDDFARLVKKKYGSDMTLSKLKSKLVDDSAYRQQMDEIWRDIREGYYRGGVDGLKKDQIEALRKEAFDKDAYIRFREDFDKRLMDKYSMSRSDVEEKLSDTSAYFDELSRIWPEIKSEFAGIGDLTKSGKYVRMRAEKIMQYELAQAKQQAALREKLLDRAMPRQTQIADHDTSVQSYTAQVSGAVKGDYGTGAYQTSVYPLDPEYGRLEQQYVTGNNYHENRLLYDVDGTIVNYGQANPRAEFGDLFTRRQVQDMLDATSRMSDVEWFDYVANDPDARALVERMLFAANRLDEINVSTASKAIAKANKANGATPGSPGYIAPPKASRIPNTIDGYIMQPHDLRRLVKTIHGSMEGGFGGFGGPGYATYMDRTPVASLRHKYGGLIEKIGSVYGNDMGRIKSAFRTVRINRKK